MNKFFRHATSLETLNSQITVNLGTIIPLIYFVQNSAQKKFIEGKHC